MEINYIEVEQALKAIFQNIWLLTFASLWVAGWWLKEHSPINNKLIPSILLLLGAVLGLFVIDFTFAGAIIGLLMAYIIIAFYEHIKNTIEFFAVKKP